MCVTGSLTDFSLPELFQWIEKGNKTGLLTLRALSGAKVTPPQVHYLWVYQGYIVAAANRLDNQGLASLIIQCKWLSDRVFDKLLRLCCPIDEPLGLSLKNHCVLGTGQLEQLFQIQLLQQVSLLFQLKDAQFIFDSNAPISTREMTGLSVPATEATLMGLRVLQNRDGLSAKLPNPYGGLVSIIVGKPQCRLDALEWQVWDYTNGTISLAAIAQQLKLPLEKVQQIALRFITVGLAEEVPLLISPTFSQAVKPLPTTLLQEAKKQILGYSLLQNVAGFFGSQTSGDSLVQRRRNN
ncbi:MAG TPA: DUF4388 domain-containing protein [Oculatellaceae cyanobacterium]